MPKPQARSRVGTGKTLFLESVDSRSIAARRFKEVFWQIIADIGGDPTEAHLDFHAGHHPERGPYSVCMHRPNAQTVSFSWIRVDRDGVRFRYTPDSLCRGRPALEIELARRHD